MVASSPLAVVLRVAIAVTTADAQFSPTPTPAGGDKVIMTIQTTSWNDCSGPCPPPPPPADTDPINSDDWKFWIDGECNVCGDNKCGNDSKDPTITLPQAEKYECAGPNTVLYTMYTDAKCTNQAKWSDFWKSQFGPTATSNTTFPIRMSTNSFVDLGTAPTGSGADTGRLSLRLGGFHGCSDQVMRYNTTAILTCSPGPAPCPPMPPAPPPADPQTAIIGECTQPYAPSRDPNIDTESMAIVYECDGPKGLKATMFKDPNCVTKGSWYDFYTGVSGGPGVNFNQSLGDVLAVSMDKPTMLASSGAIRFGEQLNTLHGCNATTT